MAACLATEAILIFSSLHQELHGDDPLALGKLGREAIAIREAPYKALLACSCLLEEGGVVPYLFFECSDCLAPSTWPQGEYSHLVVCAGALILGPASICLQRSLWKLRSKGAPASPPLKRPMR